MFVHIDHTLTRPPLRNNSEQGLMAVLSLLFGLHRAQSSLLVKLAKFDFVSKAEAHAATAPDGKPTSDSKIVAVIVCTLQRRLKPFDIKITNVHGQGYRLDEEARNRLRELLRAHGQDVVAAATPVNPIDRNVAA